MLQTQTDSFKAKKDELNELSKLLTKTDNNIGSQRRRQKKEPVAAAPSATGTRLAGVSSAFVTVQSEHCNVI